MVTEGEKDKSMDLEGHVNEALDLNEDPGDSRVEEISRKDDKSEEVEKEVSGPNDDEEFEDLEFEPNIMTQVLHFFRGKTKKMKSLLPQEVIQRLPTVLVFLLYHIFFFYAIYHYSTQEDATLDWCNGLGFLIIITIISYVCFLHSKVCKPLVYKFANSKAGKSFRNKICKPVEEAYKKVLNLRFTKMFIYIMVFGVIILFLIIDSSDDRRRLTSGLGLAAMVLFGFLFSKHPDRVVWRHVVWGVTLQFVFGLIILRWDFGKDAFECLGDKVSEFLDYTDAGSSFVFGSLVSQQPFWTFALDENSTAYEVATQINESKAFAWVFMFKVLSVIFFFSFFISMLFYLGWMQIVVIKLGWVLQKTVGTTACESLNAAANIFLGQSEAPLMIKPYIAKMTNSELHAVMTGGFATIAGSVLAAYISFGVSASHLLSASVMSAPAALAMAKLVYPETKKTKTLSKDISIVKGQEANLLDAASQGAVVAVTLVANIGGTLVAFLAFVGFLNGIVGWAGGLVGIENLSFEIILGKIFIPLAWLMGVPEEDLEKVGILLGLKTFVNEFAAYDRMSTFDDLQERSRVISTYALCGFSNPGSIGIQIAALGSMAPRRKGDLARVAFSAFVAGSLACFMTACVAGMLIQ